MVVTVPETNLVAQKVVPMSRDTVRIHSNLLVRRRPTFNPFFCVHEQSLTGSLKKNTFVWGAAVAQRLSGEK
jgi:hypothetical protein